MDAPLNKDSPKEARAFVRLVGFNARGAMLESALYKNGEGADASALLVGRSNERILLGKTRSPYTAQVIDPDDPKAPPQEKSAIAGQGWAIAVPGGEPL
ncbi:MAG: hypothetical protein LRY54_04375 [Alphaproteobacteria bacterium]|nr:hypothetical protein [Alphaproteobacteria bacterium]